MSLELGGKSAAIVLEDADLDAMAEGLKFLSFANNGEACVAHTRILVHRSRYDEAVAKLKELVESLTVGYPMAPDTFIGPMVRADQQERVRSYIETGIREGARLVTGGPEVPAGLEGGYYVTPTLFADVDNFMRIAREEIFGPVLVVIPFDDDDHAVRIANDSPTAWAAACGRPTRAVPSPSPGASAPAPSPSTERRPPSTARSAGSRTAASAGSSARPGSPSTSSTRRSPSDRSGSQPCGSARGVPGPRRAHPGRRCALRPWCPRRPAAGPPGRDRR